MATIEELGAAVLETTDPVPKPGLTSLPLSLEQLGEPVKLTTGQIIQRGLTAPFRVGRAIALGAYEAITTEITGLPTALPAPFVEKAQQLGLLRTPGRNPFQEPFAALSQMAIHAGAAGIEVLVRAINTPIEAGIQGAIQIHREFNPDKTANSAFERELRRNVDAGLIATAPLFVGAAQSRLAGDTRRMVRRVDKTVKEFTKQLPKEQRAMATSRIRESVINGLSDSALQTARRKIGQPSIEDIMRESRFTTSEKMTIDYLDEMRAIKILAEDASGVTKLTADLTPYREMRLLAGNRVIMELAQIKGTFKWNKNGDLVFNGESLRDAVTSVTNHLEEFQLFAFGKRGAELRKRTGKRKVEVPFTDKEITSMLNLGKINPKLPKAFDRLQAWNRRILGFAEQSGLINAATKKAFLEAGKDFVPMYRIMVEDGVPKLKATGSVFKRMKGGKGNVGELMDNFTRNANMIIDASLRNHARVKVIEMIEDLKLGTVAKRVSTGEVTQALLLDKGVKTALKSMGHAGADDFVKVLSFNKRLDDKHIAVFRAGKRELWRIDDPEVFKAFHAFTPKAYGMTMRILSGASNLLRLGVTLGLEFMGRNVIRDTQAAFIQSKTNFIPIISSIRGMKSRITQDSNYWDAMLNGLGFATLHKGEALGSRGRKFLAVNKISPDSLLNTPRRLLEGLEEIASTFELAARLEEFRMVRAKTERARAGVFAAREVSTDFALRGANQTLKSFVATIPFLNARAQGLNRLVRAAKDNPGKVALKGVLAMMIPSLGLYAINRNDPRYAQLPEWTKDMYWAIFVPGRDEPYLIPKGFEYGAIFATLPERIFEGIEVQHGKRFTDAMLRMFLDTFAFNPIPQAVKPLLESGLPMSKNSLLNRKFSGARVIPPDLERVRLSEQFRPWTSQTMIELSRVVREDTGIELSPMKMEHLVNGYLGTLGLYSLMASDELVRLATGNKGPTKRLDELPGIRAFLISTPIRNTQYQTEFFDLFAEVRMVTTTLNKMIKEGRDITEVNFTQKERRLFAIRKAAAAINNELGNINKMITLIQLSRQIQPDEKRRRIDSLFEDRNTLLTDWARKIPEDFLKATGGRRPPTTDIESLGEATQ